MLQGEAPGHHVGCSLKGSFKGIYKGLKGVLKGIYQGLKRGPKGIYKISTLSGLFSKLGSFSGPFESGGRATVSWRREEGP